MSEETKKSDANVENQEQQEQLSDEQLESASAGTDTTTGNTYYLGTANGGVWRTTDGGTEDEPVGTGDIKVALIDGSVRQVSG